MAHFSPKRAAAALAVIASIPLLAACETMTPQNSAAGSVVAANAPVADMIAAGWELPRADNAVTARRANQKGAHEVQAILPPDQTGRRPIEVSDLAPPKGDAQLAGLDANPSTLANDEIETADILRPALKK